MKYITAFLLLISMAGAAEANYLDCQQIDENTAICNDDGVYRGPRLVTPYLYEIVCNLELNDLVKSVTARLKQGWLPLGGPFEHAGAVCQAITVIRN